MAGALAVFILCAKSFLSVAGAKQHERRNESKASHGHDRWCRDCDDAAEQVDEADSGGGGRAGSCTGVAAGHNQA